MNSPAVAAGRFQEHLFLPKDKAMTDPTLNRRAQLIINHFRKEVDLQSTIVAEDTNFILGHLRAAEEAAALRARKKYKTAEDANVEDVRQMLLRRSQAGTKKYGTTTEGAGLNHVFWLKHLQEELLDAAVYLEAAIKARGGG